MGQGQAELKAQGDGRYSLSGDLVFDSVPRMLAAGEAAFGDVPSAEIDLSLAGRIDSAGLALLLEWSIAARAAGRAIRYRNAPPALATLAGISDVSELLPVATPAGT